MKSILFASTALVAFAGAAAAQGVTLSGSAQMGIQGGDTFTAGTLAANAAAPGAAAVGNAETQFVQDIDVTFTMSGETDNGLTFGAAVDLDENAGGVGTDDAGVAIFISGAFGTLTMGDTDGALDWAVAEMGGPAGSINDDHTSHAAWFGATGMDGGHDGQILRYNNTIGAFGFAVSAELNDRASGAAGTRAGILGAADDIIGLGFTYTANLGGADVNFGLGYQSGGAVSTLTAAVTPANPVADTFDTVFDGDVVAVSATTTLNNGLSLGLGYAKMDGTATTVSVVNAGAPTIATAAVDADMWGAMVGYTSGAFSVGANYGVISATGVQDTKGYGLAANYDLGGGASVQFGYGSSDRPGALDSDTWSFGVAMSF